MLSPQIFSAVVPAKHRGIEDQLSVLPCLRYVSKVVAFATESLQTPLGSPSKHPLFKCPSTSPSELLFNIVLLNMVL